MTTRGRRERFLAVNSDAERRARSEALVAEIADALAAAGEYVARIDAQPTQRVVDFNWAARQAGRRLSIRVHVDMKYSRAEPDGKAQVRVTPLNPPS
ncbi:hypothetical protein ACVW00_003651 [Marmoricola sp. URHA0025 HA25]